MVQQSPARAGAEHNAQTPSSIGGHYRTSSLPQNLMSPVNPQGSLPGQAGSPVSMVQPFSPPAASGTIPGQQPNSKSEQLRGHAAAQHVLGPLYNSPVIPTLLAQAPETGEVEFGVIKETMQQYPETQQDFARLMHVLQSRLSSRPGK